MSTLSNFKPAFGPTGYVTSRGTVLTESRFRHIWRLYSQQLIEAGAAIKLGNEIHVDPALTDEFLIDLGRRVAQASVRPHDEALKAA